MEQGLSDPGSRGGKPSQVGRCTGPSLPVAICHLQAPRGGCDPHRLGSRQRKSGRILPPVRDLQSCKHILPHGVHAERWVQETVPYKGQLQGRVTPPTVLVLRQQIPAEEEACFKCTSELALKTVVRLGSSTGTWEREAHRQSIKTPVSGQNGISHVLRG